MKARKEPRKSSDRTLPQRGMGSRRAPEDRLAGRLRASKRPATWGAIPVRSQDARREGQGAGLTDPQYGRTHDLRIVRDPQAERPILAPIYARRPDVGSVLHYHAETAIILSWVGQPARAVANCGVFFGNGTPLFDNPALITTPELDAQVAETVGGQVCSSPPRPRGGARCGLS